MQEFPPFRLDHVNECLWRTDVSGNEQRILLTPKAFGVLRYLVEHAGRLVTQEELLQAVWPNTFVQPEVLKYQIADIRSALGDNAKNPVYIETLPRRGYRFAAPVNEVSSAAAGTTEQIAEARLVGRDGPLGELCTACKQMLNGERQILFITGEPGIGKTALADEFQHRTAADVKGLRIARGQCVEGYGGKEPFYPMLEALGGLCRNASDDSVLRILVERAPSWAVQFPALLTPQDREKLPGETFATTSGRMLREICEALEVISAAFPLLLVFEDLQWADLSTIDLISALARGRARARLMLIATKRPETDESAPSALTTVERELIAHGLCREIPLRPLSEADIAEYLAAGSQNRVPDRLASVLHRRTEGNPLFLIAILEHLSRQGMIQLQDRTWQLNVPVEQVDASIPETLRGLIEARMGRLAWREQVALEAASVTGVLFSSGISAAAAHMSADRFEEVCESLARQKHVVRPTSLEDLPDGSVSQKYEFVHAIYREVFYYRQTPGRRARAHKLIGLQMETVYRTCLSDVAAQLADHFEQATDWSRAVHYLRMMADTACRRHAPREGEAILRRALELCGKIPDTERARCEIGVLEKLVSLYNVSFDMRVLTTCKRLWERAAHYGLLETQVQAFIDVVYPLSWRSTKRCLVLIERALRLAESSSDPLFRARTRASCMVRRIWASGWNASDAEGCRQSIEEIRKAADPAMLAHYLVDCNFVWWCSSNYRDAHRNAVESLPLLLKGEEENPYASFLYWLTGFVQPWSLLLMGQWGAALREIDDGIRVIEKNGDHYRAQTLRVYEAWVHLEAMDFAGVLNLCECLLGEMGTSARTPWRRFCTVLSGTAQAGLGNCESALEQFMAVRAEMDRQTVIHDWYCRMLLESGVTEVWLAKGDLGQARQSGEAFLNCALATAERTWQARAWETNARIAMIEGDSCHAAMCIAQALSVMDGYETPLAAWRVHATAAERSESIGDRDATEQHRKASREIIQQLVNSLDPSQPLRDIFLSATCKP